MVRHGGGMGSSGMGLMVLFGVLLVVGVVVLIVVLVRILGGGLRREGSSSGGAASSSSADGPVRARQILAERYARGEIDTDEYQTRMRTLEGL